MSFPLLEIGLDELIHLLLAHEQKIEAIKLVKERTGWELSRAKDYVDAQARSTPPLQLATYASPQVISQVYNLLGRGRKLQAVQLVQETTGWELQRARDYVNALAHSAPRLNAVELALAETTAGIGRGLEKIKRFLKTL